ncbi:MAG: hypothetical protein ACC630_02490 [Nitrospinota bacterium]
MVKSDIEKGKEENTAGQDNTETSTVSMSEQIKEIDKVVEERFSDVLDDEIMQGLMLETKRYLKERLMPINRHKEE